MGQQDYSKSAFKNTDELPGTVFSLRDLLGLSEVSCKWPSNAIGSGTQLFPGCLRRWINRPNL